MVSKSEGEQRQHPVLEHLSNNSKGLLHFADEMAREQGHSVVSAAHVLGSMGKTDERLVSTVLENFGITDESIKKQIEFLRLPYGDSPATITDGLKRALIHANRVRIGLGALKTTPLHIAEGLLFARDKDMTVIYKRHKLDPVDQRQLYEAMHLVVRGKAFLDSGLARRPRGRG